MEPKQIAAIMASMSRERAVAFTKTLATDPGDPEQSDGAAVGWVQSPRRGFHPDARAFHRETQSRDGVGFEPRPQGLRWGDVAL